jgi:peptidoglycan/LPS O-acetylase OafA/YrhL
LSERSTPTTTRLRRLSRFGAWALLAGIAAATLSPIHLRPITGAPADLERFLAFLALGAAFALAYPRRRWTIAALAVGGAALLEGLQHAIPGRHGHAEDFAVKAVGSVLGLVLVAVTDRRPEPRPAAPDERP